MIDPMRIVEFPKARTLAPQQAEALRHLHATLSDCLAQLDAMKAHLAGAHLSACLDVLNRDFNLD